MTQQDLRASGTHIPGGAKDSQDIEIQLLLEAIHRQCGYDFRHYARASVKRRILHRLALSGRKSISELQHDILNDPSCLDALLMDLSINVTEMFRDPAFYKRLRTDIVPTLKTYPFVKVWHAGCATGEEVYSTAIVLAEEGIYERTQVYATDFNDVVLRKAKEGIYPLDPMKDYSENYQKAGGEESLAAYYTVDYGFAKIKDALKKNILFTQHNLVTDAVFGEMNLIVCRNVLIYFDRELQDRVLTLFHESLCRRGFLCLGMKEGLEYSSIAPKFESVSRNERIYRRTEQDLEV